jgi:hypothetical protein
MTKCVRLASWRSGVTERTTCQAAVDVEAGLSCREFARFQHVALDEPTWVFLCAKHDQEASERGSVVVILRESPKEARR